MPSGQGVSSLASVEASETFKSAIWKVQAAHVENTMHNAILQMKTLP